MTPLSAFFPDILVDVPKCPEPIAQYHLVHTLSDFCVRTRALTEILDPVDVEANTQSYTVEPSLGKHYLVRIEEAWLNGVRLSPADVTYLDAHLRDWRSETGLPSAFTSEDGVGTLMLIPAPAASAAGALRVKIAYAPDPANPPTEVDPLLLRRFAAVIAAGTKARLFGIANQAWTDHNLSAKWEGVYRQEIAKAAWVIDGGNTRAPQRTRTYYR